MKPDQELMFAWATWWSQVLSTGFAGLSVGLAALFGFLTLRATKAAQRATEEAADANQRANRAATEQPPAASAPALVRWVPSPRGGEDWWLENRGQVPALEVEVVGFTDLDQRRLTLDGDLPALVSPTGVLPFQFAQRLSMSGPGALVISWREPDDEPGSERRQQRVAIVAS